MSIRVEIEDWLESDLKKATTAEEVRNIEKRQALRDQIAALVEQDDILEAEYTSLAVTKERRKREWDSMPEEHKKYHMYFSRKILEHAVDVIGLNQFVENASPKDTPKTIKFFRQ